MLLVYIQYRTTSMHEVFTLSNDIHSFLGWVSSILRKLASGKCLGRTVHDHTVNGKTCILVKVIERVQKQNYDFAAIQDF